METLGRWQRPAGPPVACESCATVGNCWGLNAAHRCGATVRRCSPVRRGTLLWHSGSEFQGVYLISRGCARLRAPFGRGEAWIDFRMAGDLLGLDGMVDGFYTYETDALEDLGLCRLEWSPDADADGSAAIGRELLRRELTDRLVERQRLLGGSADATHAVRWMLNRLATKLGVVDGDRLRLRMPMTRADLACHLGLANETVSRALRTLESSDQLRRDGRDLLWRSIPEQPGLN